MIKVIKRGSIEIRTCTCCGCKFSYEKEDVEEKCIDGYKAYRRFVRCPQCDEEVIIAQTR
jgi:NAD-dependent SIR2 family protein deacetylase